MSNKCPISRTGLAIALAVGILAAPLPAAASDGNTIGTSSSGAWPAVREIDRERFEYRQRQREQARRPSPVEIERREYRERQRRLERERGR